MSAAPGRLRQARGRFIATTRPLIWGGNNLRLLQNGDEFFPMLIAAIDGARQSVFLETYIFAGDNIGLRVGDALASAASRGVAVHVVVDGFGSADYCDALQARLKPVGVRIAVFRRAYWWRPDRRLLRRLHRKLALIDDRLAFVGGINIIGDYHHPDTERVRLGPRFDFAVLCEGPIVAAVALTMRRLWRTLQRLQFNPDDVPDFEVPAASLVPTIAGMRAALLLRDNLRHRRTIEADYRQALASAHHDVIIACAYFFPGRSFRKALVECARRGVRVRLLVQGRIEYAVQHYAQQALYGQLLEAGVQIHEYEASYLHAKVAVADETWATVGSSNIDPYSLLLAREANVSVYDAGFARALRAALETAIDEHSRRVDPAAFAGRSLLARAVNWVAYGVLRFGAVALAGGRDY